MTLAELSELIEVQQYRADDIASRRAELLRSVGKSYDELIRIERQHELTLEEDAVLQQLRSLDFLEGNERDN